MSMLAISCGELTSWARKADEGSLSSLSAGERLTFDSNDPMIALSIAGAVAERIP